MLKTENHEPLFAEMPQTHFLSKLKQYFSFMENYSKISEDSCSVLKITMHTAIFATGIIGYTEILTTKVKPSHFRIIDLNTLVHSVVHTYHPEKN